MVLRRALASRPYARAPASAPYRGCEASRGPLPRCEAGAALRSRGRDSPVFSAMAGEQQRSVHPRAATNPIRFCPTNEGIRARWAALPGDRGFAASSGRGARHLRLSRANATRASLDRRAAPAPVRGFRRGVLGDAACAPAGPLVSRKTGCRSAGPPANLGPRLAPARHVVWQSLGGTDGNPRTPGRPGAGGRPPQAGGRLCGGHEKEGDPRVPSWSPSLRSRCRDATAGIDGAKAGR